MHSDSNTLQLMNEEVVDLGDTERGESSNCATDTRNPTAVVPGAAADSKQEQAHIESKRRKTADIERELL